MIRVLTADELKDLAGDRVDAGFGSIETTQGCLPLTSLDVDVQIEGLAAETTVRQQFRNVFDGHGFSHDGQRHGRPRPHRRARQGT